MLWWLETKTLVKIAYRLSEISAAVQYCVYIWRSLIKASIISSHFFCWRKATNGKKCQPTFTLETLRHNLFIICRRVAAAAAYQKRLKIIFGPIDESHIDGRLQKRLVLWKKITTPDFLDPSCVEGCWLAPNLGRRFGVLNVCWLLSAELPGKYLAVSLMTGQWLKSQSLTMYIDTTTKRLKRG